MGGLTRTSFLCAVVAALVLAPVAMAHGQEGPPPQRDRACERNQAPSGNPPFCDEYPPPGKDVACDRSKAPPGRPPFCHSMSMAAGSQASVQLLGPAQSPSTADTSHAPVREYTVPVDEAGVARFEAPEDLEPGHYQVTFAPVDGVVDHLQGSQAFEVIAPAAVQSRPAVSTGGPVLTYGTLVAAVLVIVTGGATLLVARRRGIARVTADSAES